MKRRSPPLAKRQGIIFILSAPSGAGKTTLYNELREIYPEIKLSVSWTTRARRAPVKSTDATIASSANAQFAAHEAARRIRRMGQGPRLSLRHAAKAARSEHSHGTRYSSRYRRSRRAQDQTALSRAVSIFLLPPSMRELRRRLVRPRHRRQGDDSPAAWPMPGVK